MKTFARVQDGRVVELLKTEASLTGRFHPALAWFEVSSVLGIAEGWSYDGEQFTPPPPTEPAPSPTLEALQAQLANLTAQIAALSKAK